MKGLLAKKLGMTQLFNADGTTSAVTVLEPLPIATKFNTAMGPEPEIAGDPGTRETVRVASPVSLRISFTEVTRAPPRVSSSPGVMSFSRNWLGLNLIRIGEPENRSAALST